MRIDRASPRPSYRVVSEGEACTIRNVVVGSTNWIFSDGNGTVVLRADEVEEVLTTASRSSAARPT
jgi:regulator of RNase E activity RraA